MHLDNLYRRADIRLRLLEWFAEFTAALAFAMFLLSLMQ